MRWLRLLQAIVCPLGFVVLGGIVTPIAAQQTDDRASAQNRGWISVVGLARYGFTDELASPFRHKGNGLLLGAGYRSVSEKSAWSVQASYSSAVVGSRLQTGRGGFEDTWQGDIGLWVIRSVGTLGSDRLRVYVGGSADVRASIRKHHYDLHTRGTGTEWFGDVFAPLQVGGMLRLSLGRSTLSQRVFFPLISLVLRSPYNGLKHAPTAKIAGPADARGFSTDLTFRIPMTSHWSLGVFHRMIVLAYPSPLPLASVVHQLGLELGAG